MQDAIADRSVDFAKSCAPRFWLGNGVHFCVSGADFVFLNIGRDLYFTLPTCHAEALHHVVHGWPSPMTLGVHTTQKKLPRKTMRALRTAGLITRRLDEAISVATPAANVRTVEPAELTPTEVSVTARDLLNTARAVAQASVLSRCRSFSQRVEWVRSKRREHPLDVARAVALTAVFERARTVFYAAEHHCLFDSIALFAFLGRHRIYPRWIFAVRAEPWIAHCWLQAGAVALNDRNAQARDLRTILEV